MMKRLLAVWLLAMAGAIPAIAQDKDSFESFRKGILDEFDSFRNEILDHYDKFLEGIWTEYNAFRGKERSTIPKPKKAPVAKPVPGRRPVTQTPVVPDPQPEPQPLGERTQEPEPAIVPEIPAKEWDSFTFYCMTVKVPRLELDAGLCPTKDFAALWRFYKGCKVDRNILPALKRRAAEYGLNDWFIFELVRSYVNGIFPAAGPEMRVSLMHYLLSYWGYDARIGMEGPETPVLLVAIRQQVYGHTYVNLDGRNYYLFYDGLSHADQNQDCSFSTCNLPETAKGKALNMVIDRELNIPYLPHPYKFSYGGLTIAGEVNANLMPMLYRYPGMDLGKYASSAADEKARREVVEQLRVQLAGMPQREAVDTLLHFVQYAFEYATDGEQHGFEKPYFFEEMLFYPKCDCEDRALFYSYLLWHVLKVENQLINYPGHEAVAVHLDVPVGGDGYMYKGKHFYISDPTYIGMGTGACMPDYQDKQPRIDFYYGKAE